MVQLLGPQIRDRPGHGLEIVEQPHLRKTERALELACIELPRQVGGLAAIAEHRTGDGKARGLALRCGLVEVALHERI